MNLDKRCYDFVGVCNYWPVNNTTICLVAQHQRHLTFEEVAKNVINDLEQLKNKEKEKE